MHQCCIRAHFTPLQIYLLHICSPSHSSDMYQHAAPSSRNKKVCNMPQVKGLRVMRMLEGGMTPLVT